SEVKASGKANGPGSRLFNLSPADPRAPAPARDARPSQDANNGAPELLGRGVFSHGLRAFFDLVHRWWTVENSANPGEVEPSPTEQPPVELLCAVFVGPMMIAMSLLPYLEGILRFFGFGKETKALPPGNPDEEPSSSGGSDGDGF